MAPQKPPTLFTIAEADADPARRIKAAANALWTEIYQRYGLIPTTGALARQRAITRLKLEETVMWCLNTPNGG